MIFIAADHGIYSSVTRLSGDAFHFHAGFNIIAEQIQRNRANQFRFAFSESIFRFQGQRNGISGLLPHQGLFEFRKNIIVSEEHLPAFFRTFLQLISGEIKNIDLQPSNRIFSNYFSAIVLNLPF